MAILIVYANIRPLAIKDPNTGIILWESCAIISYLIAEYDKSHTLSYASAPEKYLQDQWLFFQASGQGLYYGQAGWYFPPLFLNISYPRIASGESGSSKI